jgi:hypothetical protein
MRANAGTNNADSAITNEPATYRSVTGVMTVSASTPVHNHPCGDTVLFSLCGGCLACNATVADMERGCACPVCFPANRDGSADVVCLRIAVVTIPLAFVVGALLYMTTGQV